MNIEPSKSKQTFQNLRVSSDATTDLGRMRMEDTVMATANALRVAQTQQLGQDELKLKELLKHTDDLIKKIENLARQL